MKDTGKKTEIRSMTGYARAQKSCPSAEVTVTLKSVNHRGLDLHFHLGEEMGSLEERTRAMLRARIRRGHIEVRMAAVRAAVNGSAGLNRKMFLAYAKALKEASEQMGVEAPALNPQTLLSVPGMVISDEQGGLDEPAERAAMEALEEALEAFDEFRKREGAEIAALIVKHNRQVQERAAEMEKIRTRAIPVLQARIGERLREMLRGVSLDPQRLAQEAAVLADRGDIGEEIERLKIHARQVEELLAEGGETGKRLDFLLQEMNRESNTILSKTSGAGELGLKITELALAAKSDIEKIREHALNLE